MKWKRYLQALAFSGLAVVASSGLVNSSGCNNSHESRAGKVKDNKNFSEEEQIKTRSGKYNLEKITSGMWAEDDYTVSPSGKVLYSRDQNRSLKILNEKDEVVLEEDKGEIKGMYFDDEKLIYVIEDFERGNILKIADYNEGKFEKGKTLFEPGRSFFIYDFLTAPEAAKIAQQIADRNNGDYSLESAVKTRFKERELRKVYNFKNQERESKEYFDTVKEILGAKGLDIGGLFLYPSFSRDVMGTKNQGIFNHGGETVKYFRENSSVESANYEGVLVRFPLAEKGYGFIPLNLGGKNE